MINYDETNLANDTITHLLKFCKGSEYKQHVMNNSKTIVSIMFTSSVTRKILLPYFVYKKS